MNWLTDDLATLSGGSGRRAAAILVTVHLLAGAVAVGLWAIGLLRIFDDVRWIPTTIVAVYAIVASLGLLLRFGFWGIAATAGRSGGEDLERTFSPGAGFALGWLRWLLQLVAVAILTYAGVMTYANVRPWHLFGAEELDELSELAASMPVPDDWTLVDTEATDTGFPAFMDGPEGTEPTGHVEQTFEVPASYSFDDLKAWLASPEWAEAPRGASFGAIQVEHCVSERTRCDARRVPPPGEQPVHFLRATLDEPSFDGDVAEVEVRLDLRPYVDPDWEVSDETVERAMAIPIPSDWVRYSILEEETNSGDSFAQFFGVPETFTADDLEAWLHGPSWTDPETGEAFGAIEVEPCREVGVDGHHLCSAIVAGTRRSPGDGAVAGPVESLSVSLMTDNRVRVSLERNG